MTGKAIIKRGDFEIGNKDPSKANGVANEVEERGAIGNKCAVCCHAVADSSHGVFSHSESDVSASIAALASADVLKVRDALELSHVGRSKVSRAAHELWHSSLDCIEHVAREVTCCCRLDLLAGSARKERLDVCRELALGPACKLGSLGRVLA